MEKNITIDDLISKMDGLVESKKELDDINEAYLFAKESHKGKKRKTNEEFITHPLNVAYILAGLNVDTKTIVAALLHETINHGSSTYESICDTFGSEIANIVLSISKINKLELTDDSESSSIYLRKILVGLSEDVRVLFIKLADRLHNMRTVYALTPEEQKQKANETMKVLIPIAHRLGINKIKSELEDLCLKYLKPDVYADIEKELTKGRAELNEVLNEMKENISNILIDYGLRFEIKGRVKSINSIYEKLAKGRKFSDIYDILALRILLPKENDCYLAVGLIHAKYRPIPKRFKDYIAMPKENMYQSLHTTVFGIDGYLFEIQLRTYEMDEIAEKGIASHWSYKESGTQKIQNMMEQKLEMFRNLIEANSDTLNDETLTNISNEYISNLIYVYTPKGDVVELPEGATPIDFAYRIHSGVGDTMVGALVNDQIVPLDHSLSDGDIVKIRIDKNSHPKEDWLKIVKTTQAKDKIKAYFSKQDKIEYIKKGELLLDKELKKRKISANSILDEEALNKIFKGLKLKDLDDLYLAIGTLRYLPSYIIEYNSKEKDELKDPLLMRNRGTILKEKIYNGNIIVSGCDDIKVTIANCCKPVKGDTIVGYITKGRGVSVHLKDCPNISSNEDRFIDVKWNEENDNFYYTDVTIETDSLSDHLMEIISKTGQKEVFIESINKKEIENGINYTLTVKLKTLKELNSYLLDLEKLNYIKKVGRTNK